MNDDEQRVAQLARLLARADRVTHEWLPLSALQIGPYQRVLKQGDVKRMVADFDLDRLDELLVSRRENGELYLIDGQHRRAALIEMGWGGENVPCKVLHGLTQDDEAWRFEAQGPGMRRNLSRLDMFRSAHVRGDPAVTGLVKTVESAGLRIDWTEGGGRGTVRAVAALATINGVYGPDALRRVLVLLPQCFGDESRVFNADVGAATRRWRWSHRATGLTLRMAGAILCTLARASAGHARPGRRSRVGGLRRRSAPCGG